MTSSLDITWQPIRHTDTKTGAVTIDQYAKQSDCGKYTLARVYLAGDCWYEAYFEGSLVRSSLDQVVTIQACKDHKAAQVIHVEQRHENGDGI